MMSEEKKKSLRTQGRYSDINCDKRQRAAKELTDRKYNRRSNGSKRASNSFAEKDVPHVRYEENAVRSFHQLDEPNQPIEIYERGLHVLSTTNNGESKIFYEPYFLEDNKTREYFDDLRRNINWYSKNIIINGEEKEQPRMVAWFGPYPYSYSGATLEPAEMPNSVLEIKQQVEEHLEENGIKATFNSVLLNLYRDNRDSVAWHSDDELTMGICPTIASVSLGETRKFELRPKKKYMEYESPAELQVQYFVYLTNGSLIVMDGCMQHDWQHQIPKEYHDKEARINLTFRTVYPLKKNSHNRSSERAGWRKDVGTLNSKKVCSCIPLDDEAFPPLSSNSSHPFSVKGSNNILEASSSSLESDALNKSDDIWESESSVVESVTGDLNSDNSYNSSFETSNVEHSKKNVDQNNSSFETNDLVSSLRKSLNVSAKEFVPNFAANYRKPSLKELINYEVNFMHGTYLLDFADSLKSTVKEKLSEFPRKDREELEFLCLLTDGTQTEKNQKIITSRMVKIVSNNLERVHSCPYVEKTDDRSHNYKKQNNISRGKNAYNRW